MSRWSCVVVRDIVSCRTIGAIVMQVHGTHPMEIVAAAFKFVPSVMEPASQSVPEPLVVLKHDVYPLPEGHEPPAALQGKLLDRQEFDALRLWLDKIEGGPVAAPS